MTRAVIAGFTRTPFHFANKGKLVGVRPDDLAAIAGHSLTSGSAVRELWRSGVVERADDDGVQWYRAAAREQ